MNKIKIIFLALITGSICAFIIFSNQTKIGDSSKFPTAVLFQLGVFSNYDNALNKASQNQAVVILENDSYKVIKALLFLPDNIQTMEDYLISKNIEYIKKNISIKSGNNIDKEIIFEKNIINSDEDTFLNGCYQLLLSLYDEGVKYAYTTNAT